MAQSERIDVLLRKAQQDENAAACLLEDDGIGDEIIGFHMQQAIEKQLKALLVHLDVDYPKTHVLELLAELLESKGVQMPADVAEIESLTSFAVAFRYDDLPFKNCFDRSHGLRLVALVREWVAKEMASRIPQSQPRP